MTTVRTAKKLLLGREIANMMKATDTTQVEVAKFMETSPSRVNGLLAGQNSISVGDVERLARHLGFTEEKYLETLREMRRDNHKRGYWNTGYRRAYSEEMRLRVDVEKHADRIREFEVEIMPGLLQCESYVRALYADLPDQNGLTLEDQVQARVTRQDIYEKDGPPRVHFVLSESCLRRVWGDKAVMREQFAYLLRLSQREHVMVQVLPFDAPVGRRTPIGNRFTLLRIPSPGAAGPLELAYTEGEGEFRYLDDKKAVDAYDNAWTRLTTAALSFEESRKFLRKVGREFA
ncbi:helix-turn-helix domain-containing protein [Actinophytocola gossypii]|uniref:Helix-turn-helix domain-containing protein n=1 Tax=Actinophytocola gossypii TaxID=2812003 RepID=A0ABT2J5B7_9PSEU|nr:Scr1 family TA system antitoxin-like transcriptional regulator [Actinophytocola gossypii]MCT2583058.1 helix-turn-helix domain-containing protein [Actinophytocola gossypii]